MVSWVLERMVEPKVSIPDLFISRLNNCIGHQNHKYFYLFLVYTSIYCVIIFATTLPETLRMANQPLVSDWRIGALDIPPLNQCANIYIFLRVYWDWIWIGPFWCYSRACLAFFWCHSLDSTPINWCRIVQPSNHMNDPTLLWDIEGTVMFWRVDTLTLGTLAESKYYMCIKLGNKFQHSNTSLKGECHAGARTQSFRLVYSNWQTASIHASY